MLETTCSQLVNFEMLERVNGILQGEHIRYSPKIDDRDDPDGVCHAEIKARHAFVSAQEKMAHNQLDTLLRLGVNFIDTAEMHRA